MIDYKKKYFSLVKKILGLTQWTVDNTTPDVVSVTFEKKKKPRTKKSTNAHKKTA